jgi:hypothetical protein
MIPKGMLWMEKSESGLVSMKDIVAVVCVEEERVGRGGCCVVWGKGVKGKEEKKRKKNGRRTEASTVLMKVCGAARGLLIKGVSDPLADREKRVRPPLLENTLLCSLYFVHYYTYIFSATCFF